jgi:hypothetical protein
MSTNRTTPPPRVRQRAAAGGQQRAPETIQMGDTTEREVRPPEGDLGGGKPGIPIEDESFPPTVRSSVRLSGIRLSDILSADEIAEARKGIGPTVVILHNIVSGPGTRTTGALQRGKVVRLSALVGEDVVEALHPDFEPETAADRSRVIRARKLLAHYTGGDDPAIREARPDERDLDKIVFAETEEEALKALDARDEQLNEALSDNERMREAIQQIAKAGDDPAAIAEILSRAGVAASPGMGRRAVGSSPESRLNPSDELPEEKTGDERPGRRDPGFIQQRPQNEPNPGDSPIPPGAKVERQGATAGQEPETGGTTKPVDDETLEEAFDEDEMP